MKWLPTKMMVAARSSFRSSMARHLIRSFRAAESAGGRPVNTGFAMNGSWKWVILRLCETSVRDRARQEEPVAALLAHAARLFECAFAASPEEITPDHALYCAAGVLGHHQALERPVGRWPGGLKPEGDAEREIFRVDGERTPGGKRDALRTDRARAVEEPKEDEAFVAVHQLLGTLRVGA